MMVSKRNFIFWGLPFRFHVKFRGCTCWLLILGHMIFFGLFSGRLRLTCLFTFSLGISKLTDLMKLFSNEAWVVESLEILFLLTAYSLWPFGCEVVKMVLEFYLYIVQFHIPDESPLHPRRVSTRDSGRAVLQKRCLAAQLFYSVRRHSCRAKWLRGIGNGHKNELALQF